MATPLMPIEPKGMRWEPNSDPNDITVPGLDTNASVNEQVEQIEQLITIKLQNIDANFSKIQQVMASRILPAVKRYAVGTESVREAAKFWTTFYEQAAQIRVPTYDDYSVPHDSDSQVNIEDTQEASETSQKLILDQSRSFDPNRTSSEVSFAPGQAAIMSTPARQHSRYEEEPIPSWSASIESPLVRLDRELQSLTEQDASALPSSSIAQQSNYEDDPQDATERQIDVASFADQTIQSQSNKSMAKPPAGPLLKGILRRNADISMSQKATTVSPLKVKQRTPNLKSLNPYLPPDTNPSEWKGVVDLTDPRVLTPGRGGSPAKRRYGPQPVSAKRPSTPQFNDDDSFDVGLGMSPPITMAFAQPPSAKAPKLGRTPRKQAAQRITQNLVSKETSTVPSTTRHGQGVFSRPGGTGSIESSIISVPSPPSLTKYTRHSAAETSSSLADASLESMMRRVGLDVPILGASHSKSTSTTDTPESFPVVPTSNFLHSHDSHATTSQLDETPQMPQIDFSRVRVEDDLFGEANASLDSDDSFDAANNTAQPSAAFMMAVASHSNFDDDSFDTNPNDSIDFEDDDGMMNPHPFENMVMREGDSFDDDSFDDPVFDQHTEEETLFGVPPAQRLQAHAAFQHRQSLGTNLRMAGQDLLDDTLGIGAQRAQAGHVQETPTPWNGGREY